MATRSEGFDNLKRPEYHINDRSVQGFRVDGIVKLTKSSVAQPQEMAIGRHCEHDA
jgi:hypothetical protein